MTFLRKLFAIFSLASCVFAGDWTTFGHDAQRTGWAFEETDLTPETVPKLELKWKARVDNQFYSLSALTAPVVATGVTTVKGIRGVVYVAGISGTVFALDAKTGEEIWNHPFKTAALPGKGRYQGTFLCPNGITATPVIDRSTGILYVIASDGALYGLDLGGGKVRYGPVQFVAPFAKSWSLSLVDGVVYTTLSQGCGTGISGVYAVNVRDPHRPTVRQMLLSNTDTAGIWGRGGPVIGENARIYGGAADGYFDPIAGDYSDSVVAISVKSMSLADYFLPPNWDYLRRKDFDLGSASPVWFGWKNRGLLAGGFKEGVIYLMDANQLGGKDHQTPLYTSPRLGNDKAVCCEGLGIWGGLSTYRDTDGQTWLFSPMGGPPSATGPKFPRTNGENPHGSIMAFKVVADPKTQNPVLEPAWISGDFNLPDPVVIANGVVFGLSTGENAVQRGGEVRRLTGTHPAVLKALDAKTGKELYNSGDAIGSWVHFSGLAIGDGCVYTVDHDSTVYAFGIKGK
jgi:outer membrane protein assembly factor BamB